MLNNVREYYLCICYTGLLSLVNDLLFKKNAHSRFDFMRFAENQRTQVDQWSGSVWLVYPIRTYTLRLQALKHFSVLLWFLFNFFLGTGPLRVTKSVGLGARLPLKLPLLKSTFHKHILPTIVVLRGKSWIPKVRKKSSLREERIYEENVKK